MLAGIFVAGDKKQSGLPYVIARKAVYWTRARRAYNKMCTTSLVGERLRERER